MTVAELIEALQNMPSDAEVFTYQVGDDTPESDVNDAYLCYTGHPEEPYRGWENSTEILLNTFQQV